MIVRSIARLASAFAGLFVALVPLAGIACSGSVHIEIKDSGVYALDYATIVHAQPALRDCRADDLYLLNRDKEVPIRVVSGGDGEFRDGDRIEWLGQALHGPQSWFDQYSSVNVYQLGAKAGNHARVKEITAVAAPAKPVSLQRTLHIEQENLMLRVSEAEMKPGEEPDVWQWAKLTPVDAKPFVYTFDLPDFDASAAKRAMSSFTFDFRGMSNVRKQDGAEKAVDHVVEISVNGKPLQRLTWDGRDEWRKTVEVESSALKEKGNDLTIRVLKRDIAGGNFIVDVVMFNWFEANYSIRSTLSDYAVSFSSIGDGAVALGGRDSTAVFGTNGTLQSLPADNKKLAVTVNHDVDYFASTAEHYLAPPLVRAIADDDERAATTGYDYIIVAHPRLLEAIKPLAQYHRDHGLTVGLYNVDDVYDQFNGGVVHPSAIRDLVAWGLGHWNTKPRYLLLVGDASFDIHHDQRTNTSSANQYAIRTGLQRDELLAQGSMSSMDTTRYAKWDEDLPNRNLIPTWQFPTGEGQSATDNPFVALQPDDFHPQLAVGRFPVVDAAEVSAIVAKTIGYLEKPIGGEWRRDVTLVSTSEVPSFKGESDKISQNLQQRGFSVNNIYTDFHETDSKTYQQVRTTLKEDLDAGDLLVHFIGHGGQFIWRVGPIGDLFTLNDVSALKNVGRYPMVLAMTCFSAPFDHPTDDSIGERFLREPNKGAVAVFAASWSNWPNPENSSALINELLKPGKPIGDAIVTVKSKTIDRTLVEMYNLLGDPAIVLAQPKDKIDFMRVTDRWNPSVVVRIGSGSFGGNVDVDWLDDHGVLSSRKYEARDAQFSLVIPHGATRLNVYAENTHTGAAAFGSIGLPAIVATPPEKTVAKSLVTVRHKKQVRVADTISQSDFEQ